MWPNDKTAVLNLPAADAGIWRAVEKVDAASVDECAFRCVDCLIPFLRDAINNATHVCLNRQANGLSCGSVILLEQLRTIDKSRLRERVGALDTSEMKQIDWALGVSVGLVEGYR